MHVDPWTWKTNFVHLCPDGECHCFDQLMAQWNLMTDPADLHDDPELVDVTTLPDDVPDGEVDTNDD